MDLGVEMELDAAQSALRRRLLRGGADSPSTVNAMGQVADRLRLLKRHGEELQLRIQIVESMRRNLGLEHEDTINSEARLGFVLYDLDRKVEAEPLFTHVVSETMSLPQEMNHETYNSILGLALIYINSDRLNEARRLLEDGLAEMASPGQEETPAIEYVYRLLASVLIRLHDSASMIPRYRRIVADKERTLGPNHFDTLDALKLLTKILISADNAPEARVRATELVQRWTYMVGEGDARTMSARDVLASLDSPFDNTSD
jgi:eukaryotic-like serine/threonine-protein kinase